MMLKTGMTWLCSVESDLHSTTSNGLKRLVGAQGQLLGSDAPFHSCISTFCDWMFTFEIYVRWMIGAVVHPSAAIDAVYFYWESEAARSASARSPVIPPSYVPTSNTSRY